MGNRRITRNPKAISISIVVLVSMATVEIGLLLAARESGVFDRSITMSEQMYFKETVVTGHKILDLIKSTGDVSTDYLARHLSLNQNTCKIYCRYLTQLGLLSVSKSKSQGAVKFYKIIDNKPIEE